ncbi:MAG TPA: serine hydrolase domain-containing protein [Levilinea sp.]|nr:serine hydrolase domain-containing protein [Levilinea sp.]
MDIEQVTHQITEQFGRLVQADAKIHNAYLLVHSDRSGLHLCLAQGESETAAGERLPANPEQPVFMASVGKLFTATVIAMLVEQGKLTFETRIVDLLDKDLLRGLHVVRGEDCTAHIQLKHLLNHTSGLHDFWEEKPAKGKGMLQQLLDEPDKAWSPLEVVRWSKENLKSHFKPGGGFHYSDTGYHLLGLSIEAVTGMSFPVVLSRYLFEPLEMKRAFLIGHSQPLEASPQPLAGVYIGKTNVIHYRSLSVDYAGGAVTAPLEDLLKFMRALAQGRILKAETLERMDDCAKFSIGIDYGYGMMKIRTVPVVMPAKFNCWGNAGSSGAFMFYHAGQDAYLIGSLNQFRYAPKGIRFMLRTIDTLIKGS